MAADLHSDAELDVLEAFGNDIVWYKSDCGPMSPELTLKQQLSRNLRRHLLIRAPGSC